MTGLQWLAVAAACGCAHAFESPLDVTRNTIFGDEKLEGGVFENVDSYVPTVERNTSSPYRLPTTTVPTHYNLLWELNMTSLEISGRVDINLRATQIGVNEIIIHTNDQNIDSVNLTYMASEIPITYVIEPEYHFLRVQLVNEVLEFRTVDSFIYTLTVTFSAGVRTDMTGIYRSWFRNNFTDDISWIATTHFQATAARNAFPCYDEPSFKATFDITVGRPSHYNSWTGMRLRNTVNSPTDPTVQYDVFETTPVMSTYLLAMIVAEYDSIEYAPNGTLLYEVIGRPGAISSDQGQYAFETGQNLLEAMNEHTALDFHSVHPNLKMTQASISDFSAGAMENWGLLIYREAYLMYDPDNTNSYYQQLISYILSHEIAHMWFGNLVTCDWWGMLWLNEGFARYYQYYLTHWVQEYMGFDTRFIVEQVHTSLLTDSANNPHPMTSLVIGSPVEARSMFGQISYNKAAAIIRMTEHLLGFEVQRAGLRNYLIERSFSTALPIHLFTALQEAGVAAGSLQQYGTTFSIVDYFSSWSDQAGHPILNVQVNRETGDILISQRRFNINTGYSNVNSIYIIPITFATASNPNFDDTKPSHIMSTMVLNIIGAVSGNEWVVLNKQQTGFYRVNYDDYSWDLITLALRNNRTSIHEYNRAQIVNDVFQFARSGIMSYTRALNILSFLEFERDYAPWAAAITGFNWLRNRFQSSNYLQELDDLIIQWTDGVMSELTYYPIPGESFMRSYLRYQLAPFVCDLNVTDCREAAREQFLALRNSNTPVPVDSRNWVYCNALRFGSAEDFDFLWQRFVEYNVYTEKILLLQALGCSTDPDSLTFLVSNIVEDNYVIRRQDYTSAYSAAVNSNEANTQIVFNYIQNNLDAAVNAFGSADTPLSYISGRLRTEAEVANFQAWAEANQAALSTSYTAVNNGAIAARNSIAWTASVQEDVYGYLSNGYQQPETTPATTVAPTTVPPTTAPPTTESIPDSAATSVVSITLIFLAVVAHFIA